ncbi:MAG TPA: DUF1206 domain-containing protein [Mycobacteriales bacterium]|nr:DUF1206 domain-containing protein [Mycobacteriales bacterium]
MTTATARRKATAAGHRAARSDGVQRLARLGLVGRGVLYLVVAVLAANVARGSHAEADRQGALRALGAHPLGRVALVVAAFGFAGYAVWRLLEATVRPGDKGWAGRFAAFCKGCLYAGFAVSTAAFAVTRHNHNANAQNKDLTARVLGWPAGRLLVAAVGLGIVAAGVVNGWRAVSGKYRKHLKEHELNDRAAPWVYAVAVTGLVARGIAFALVGSFLVQAAWRYDPRQAEGLDGALRRLAGVPYGRPLLVLVAVGLAAYGVWSFVEARYRRVLNS